MHIAAREALALGRVGHVVPDGQALATARAAAGPISANGPRAAAASVRSTRTRSSARMPRLVTVAPTKPPRAASIGALAS